MNRCTWHELSVQGAQQIKSSSLGSSALCIFIESSLFEAADAKRVASASTGTDSESIPLCLADAKDELEAVYDSNLIDAVVSIDDLDVAVKDLKALVLRHLGLSTAAELPFQEDAVRIEANKYISETVGSSIEVALTRLDEKRPEDPLQFVIDQLEALKVAQDG
jgi:hypothetical protein